MIVVCINDDWYHPDTKRFCREMKIPYGDWFPIKDQLYEVTSSEPKSWSPYIFYGLHEDPKTLERSWCSTHFKEVDINIQDIEHEVVETAELEKELLNV